MSFFCDKHRQISWSSEECIKCAEEASKKEDIINHPNYYNKGIECLDYIVSQKMNHLEGNIIKYITRYKFKNGIEDLNKAQFYLNRLIKEIENKE